SSGCLDAASRGPALQAARRLRRHAAGVRRRGRPSARHKLDLGRGGPRRGDAARIVGGTRGRDRGAPRGAPPEGGVMAPEAVFGACFPALAYVYVAYPALVAVLAALVPRPVRRRQALPSVSILVVAHDEEARIARRIENLLALDYPDDRLEILIGSDGS